MSVNANITLNPWYGQDSRLNDCGPNAVRNVYVFFGLKSPITYKEFEKAGFRADGLKGVPVNKTEQFLTDEIMGLETMVVNVYGKEDFLNKIRAAREKNHPVIIESEEHLYTIIPHKVLRNDDIYSVLVTTPNNKDGLVYDFSREEYSRFRKDLCLCVNSAFSQEKYHNNALRLNNEPSILAFFTAEFVYRELREMCNNKFIQMKFYEIKGVNMEHYNFESTRNKKYEWDTTKKEYEKMQSIKKRLIEEAYKECVEIFNGCCSSNNIYIANKALNFLYKEIFPTYGLGNSLKENFNKNLPALIGERRIIQTANFQRE